MEASINQLLERSIIDGSDVVVYTATAAVRIGSPWPHVAASGFRSASTSSVRWIDRDRFRRRVAGHVSISLSLETKLITEQGENVVPDTYVLDGKEVDFTPRTPGGGSGKGKRTAKLGADGNSIEVSETATFDTPEGAFNVKATRKWTLSPDGKTLKIEMTVDGPNGQQVIKRTFVKK